MVCRPDGIARADQPKAARLFKLGPALDQGSFSVFKTLPPPADVKLKRILQLRLSHPEKLHSVMVLQAGSPFPDGFGDGPRWMAISAW